MSSALVYLEVDPALEFEIIIRISDDAHAGDAAGFCDLAPGRRVAIVELFVGDDEFEDVLVVVGIGSGWGYVESFFFSTFVL